MSECTWAATAARGVYMTSCRPDGVMGVPPAPDGLCPYCQRPAVRPPRVTMGKFSATVDDFRKWQAEQKQPKSQGGKP